MAPLAVILVVAALVYAGGGKGRAKRYRPGRSFDSAPVWFTSSAHSSGSAEGTQAALPAARAELTPAAASAPGVTGGASDRW
ncbi:MAG: hypothetical protein HOV71_28740 [Hamadaea sp.]|nr:hypothetical protein [Hamadaea sp.]NUR52130.1 hypothetical protein [Hamadaea sp.]NUT03814.1 hypothetical protein [Hamadaea sp.]